MEPDQLERCPGVSSVIQPTRANRLCIECGRHQRHAAPAEAPLKPPIRHSGGVWSCEARVYAAAPRAGA